MCQPFYKFLSDCNFIVTLTQINGIPISIFKFFLFDQKVFMQLAMCLIQALVVVSDKSAQASEAWRACIL